MEPKKNPKVDLAKNSVPVLRNRSMSCFCHGNWSSTKLTRKMYGFWKVER